MRFRVWSAAMSGLVFVLTALPAWNALTATPQAVSAAATRLQFGHPPPVALGAPLALTDQRGKRYALPRTDGRYTLLTFGFTQCSATCPVSLYTAKLLIEQLGTERAPEVVFITLDPLSDTPERLAGYLARFHPALVGLTGSPQAIQAAAEAFRVGQAHGKELAHSAVWYLLDPQGRTQRVYGFSTPVEHLVQDLTRIAPVAAGNHRSTGL